MALLTDAPVPLSFSNPSTSILIIGAGMAGLAAARQLVDQGLAVTLLEARSRIGGRIWTDHSLGMPIDLGGAWIHGIEGNPVAELAQRQGLQWIPADFDALELIDIDGHILTWEEHEQIDRASLALIRHLEEIKLQADLDRSMQQGLEPILKELILPEVIRRGLLWTLGSEMEIEYAANAEHLSLRYWNEDRDLPGAEVVLTEGYGALVERLAAGLDIRLSHRAHRIDYRDTPVRVHTDRGEFTAEQVIVTLPLGVLQKGSVQFWPPLPEEKQQAIHRLQMGTLNKVVLQFSQVFWPQHLHRLGLLKASTAETIEFWNYACYGDQPILVALVGGTQALALESLSPSEVLSRIMADLRRILGTDLPDPIEMIITRWGSDPFSLGSYSHVAPGAQIEDYDRIAESVQDRILFAGEATHSLHPFTVHGAYLSGIREAQRLLQIRSSQTRQQQTVLV